MQINHFTASLLTLSLLCLVLAGFGATIGHWRFENAPGFLADSGGNGLTLSASGSAPVSYALPVSGPGATFDRTFPQTGITNTWAADFGTAGPGNFLRADSAVFAVTNFTIEAYVHRAVDTTGTEYIASQYDFSNGSLRSWGLAVAGNSPPSGLAAGGIVSECQCDLGIGDCDRIGLDRGSQHGLLGSVRVLDCGRRRSATPPSSGQFV